MSEERNRLFPIFLKLEELQVLLVGGGNVGLEKLSALLANSPKARITVVADQIRDEIRAISAQNETNGTQVVLVNRTFEFADLEDKDLVILATDNPALHQSIKRVTAENHILTNVADTPDLCDFYLGSIVQKGDLKIAISTNGKSPTMAKRIKEFLNEIIPDNIQTLLENLQAYRNTLKGDFQEKVRELNDLTASFLRKS
ncbi:MAG: bifunctional precorrin-2 dehydrogenase/sirohydrochlorin ferrochelatase [Spirosomataceae bacterium]